MPKKKHEITIHIPKEMNLSDYEVAELNKVFETKLANTLATRSGRPRIPFSPVNQGNSTATRPKAKKSKSKKAAAKKAVKKGAKSTKKR
jgi:hypothetical protein